MATVRLTDETWLEYNTERVRGAITAMLGKTDEDGERVELNAAKLKRELERVGLKFTAADLATIRSVLEADGTIKIVN